MLQRWYILYCTYINIKLCKDRDCAARVYWCHIIVITRPFEKPCSSQQLVRLYSVLLKRYITIYLCVIKIVTKNISLWSTFPHEYKMGGPYVYLPVGACMIRSRLTTCPSYSHHWSDQHETGTVTCVGNSILDSVYLRLGVHSNVIDYADIYMKYSPFQMVRLDLNHASYTCIGHQISI